MIDITSSTNDRLKQLYENMQQQSNYFIGYPCNALLNDSESSRFMNFLINNVGDPYVEGTYSMNAHDLEKEIISEFSELLHLPQEERWGYLASGGTEGNLYGLLLGRSRLPSAVLYCSNESHYSVFKAARTLRMPLTVIGSTFQGEINYEELEQKLIANKNLPAVINANIGTTMKGAIDRVEKILFALKNANCNEYYIHCDSALHGAMLPYIDKSPIFDFRLPIGSLSISGHKFLGCPIPCGIVLARKTFVKAVENEVEYLATSDSTLSGSRSGLAAIALWERIQKIGKTGWRNWVDQCMGNTKYALTELAARGWLSFANAFSNIIVIKRPSPNLIRKWQLASQGPYSHIIVMPHVDKSLLDRFFIDLEGEDRAKNYGAVSS